MTPQASPSELELEGWQRDVLLLAAQGLTDGAIWSQRRDSSLSEIEEFITGFRRQRKLSRAGLALYVLNEVLIPEERQKWTKRAEADRQRLIDARVLFRRRVVYAMRFATPEQWCDSLAQIAAIDGVSHQTVSHAIAPLVKTLGGSRIRLQVTLYLAPLDPEEYPL